MWSKVSVGLEESAGYAGTKPHTGKIAYSRPSRHEVVVRKENDKTESDPSVDLIVNNMNLARLFVAVSKSTHDLGNLDESEFARSKAMKFYAEAFRSILQMRESERESFWHDLHSLSSQIRWLSIHTGGSTSSWSDANEDVFTEGLRRLLREGG